MCTIGISYQSDEENNNVNIPSFNMFKQCDLSEKTEFLSPKVMTSGNGIRYVAMTRNRQGKQPAWAGINEYGVCFVAADAYMDLKQTMPSEDEPDVFDMYLKIITDYRDAMHAASFAVEFYRKKFKQPDILMVGDSTGTYYLEAHKGKVAVVKRADGYFACTNHFRLLDGGVAYSRNRSSYLRLARAEQMLSERSDQWGIKELLKDRYYGETVYSICRYSETFEEKTVEPFYTQASVIFHVEKKNGTQKPDIALHYVINGNPSCETMYTCHPFENPQVDRPERI